MVVGVDVHPPFATSLSFSSPPLPLALLSPFFIIRFRLWGFNLVGWRFFFFYHFSCSPFLDPQRG